MVKLTVYNVQGQEEFILVNSVQSRGNYSICFDANGLPSGTYFYQIDISCASCEGNWSALFKEKREMVLLR